MNAVVTPISILLLQDNRVNGGGIPQGITVDSTEYRADSTLITADNG